ncbi:MAG: DUF1570 domain-containing protein [Planctomycetes bacterium]|nr:DUF1570 domain-containing protein [Planctomycetota bacterium]
MPSPSDPPPDPSREPAGREIPKRFVAHVRPVARASTGRPAAVARSGAGTARRLGEIAVLRGLIPSSEIARCLAIQKRLAAEGKPRRLGRILLSARLLTVEQLQALLGAQSGLRDRGRTALASRRSAWIVAGLIGLGCIGFVLMFTWGPGEGQPQGDPPSPAGAGSAAIAAFGPAPDLPTDPAGAPSGNAEDQPFVFEHDPPVADPVAPPASSTPSVTPTASPSEWARLLDTLRRQIRDPHGDPVQIFAGYRRIVREAPHGDPAWEPARREINALLGHVVGIQRQFAGAIQQTVQRQDWAGAQDLLRRMPGRGILEIEGNVAQTEAWLSARLPATVPLPSVAPPPPVSPPPPSAPPAVAPPPTPPAVVEVPTPPVQAPEVAECPYRLSHGDLREREFRRAREAAQSALDDHLARARPGAGWVTDTRHYRIHTNYNAALGAEAGERLEQLYTDFLRLFEMSDRSGSNERLPVKIFRSQRDYLDYGAPPGSAGYYRTTNIGIGERELVLFVQPSMENTWQTLMHEGTHQIDDIGRTSRTTTADVWILEGVACYYETARMHEGRLRSGGINFSRLRKMQQALDRGRFIPLERVMTVEDGNTFLGEDGLYYAEAWALVYMWLNGDHTDLPRYRRLRDMQARGRVGLATFREAFGKEPADIEEGFKAYVRGLDWETSYREEVDVQNARLSAAGSNAKTRQATLLLLKGGTDDLREFVRANPQAREIATLLSRAPGYDDFYSTRDMLQEMEIRLERLSYDPDPAAPSPPAAVAIAHAVWALRDWVDLYGLVQHTVSDEVDQASRASLHAAWSQYDAFRTHLCAPVR